MSGDIAIFEIENGSSFYIDCIKRLMRDEKDPDNIIRLEHTHDIGIGYLFQYDRKIRNIASVPVGRGINEILLPPLTSLNPEKMAYLYGVNLEDVAGKTDRLFFEDLPDIRQAQRLMIVLQDQELIAARIRGELPVAKVGQREYIVKWEEKMIFSGQNPKERIYLTNLLYSSIEGGYISPYNIRTDKAGIGFSKDCTEEDLKILVIPHERVLDPIGVARELGFADTDLLHRFPIQKQLEVKIIPVPEHLLNVFIKNGWIKGKQPQKRKGRGLS